MIHRKVKDFPENVHNNLIDQLIKKDQETLQFNLP